MNFLKLTTARLNIYSIRNYSSKHRSSKIIRQQFLDFFINENNHHFVKSSSVIPYCDPSLSFCNAGMNQVSRSSDLYLLIIIINLSTFSLKTFCWEIKNQNTLELRTHRNVFELEANTMICLLSDLIAIIIHFLRCLAIGHLVITSSKMLARWLGSF